MNKSRKLLVFSDSHGKADNMINITRRERPDMILHLGDYAADARRLFKDTGVNVFAVCGNCDFYDDEAELRELIILGHKLVLTHGSGYGVKYSYDRLIYLAEEKCVSAVLFGHTHIPYCEYEDGVWLINPGSITEPRNGMPSYAEVMIGEYGIIPKIKNFSL